MSDDVKKENVPEVEEELEVLGDASSLEDEDLEDVAGGGCPTGSGCCSGKSEL